MVCILSSIFFSFNLRNYIFQSAKKCEIPSFYMTSLHVDLNEAAKCIDITPARLQNDFYACADIDRSRDNSEI